MSLLRRFEKSLDHRLRSLFGGNRDHEPGAREAIELYSDAIEQIAARAQLGRGGERIFPFNLVTVELHAGTPERKAILEALFDAGQLGNDIRSTLDEERIEAPAGLTVNIHYNADALVEMRILCEKTQSSALPMAVEALSAVAEPVFQPARLVLMNGDTSPPEFLIDTPRVNIGREPEITDNLGRLIRRNELHFQDDDRPVNASVSRSHAHLTFDATSSEWRIFDDGSSLGTSLFRAGHRIEIPPHAARGVLLKSGDEIYLGQVQMRFLLT